MLIWLSCANEFFNRKNKTLNGPLNEKASQSHATLVN